MPSCSTSSGSSTPRGRRADVAKPRQCEPAPGAVPAILAAGASGYTRRMDIRLPTSSLALSLALAAALAGCGNKGPLVLPPPPSDDDAALMEADAVDDAGAVADPRPAGSDEQPLPADQPPVEPTPDPPAGTR